MTSERERSGYLAQEEFQVFCRPDTLKGAHNANFFERSSVLELFATSLANASAEALVCDRLVEIAPSCKRIALRQVSKLVKFGIRGH